MEKRLSKHKMTMFSKNLGGGMALFAPLATPTLGLVSHCFWEGDSSEETSTRWHCLEKLNHSRDSWLVL